MKKFGKYIAFGLIVFLTAACTTVTIDTNPKGLAIYDASGRKLGVTEAGKPVIAEYSHFIFKNLTIFIKDKNDTVVAEERLKRELKLSGLFTFILGGWLFVVGPQPTQFFEVKMPEDAKVIPSNASGFRDTVTLKNGTVHKNVKATLTEHYVVITFPNGESVTYQKSEVSSVRKP